MPISLEWYGDMALHEREPRSSETLNAVIPKCRVQFVECNSAYWSVKSCNYPPLDMKEALSIDSFKTKVKFYDGFTVWLIFLRTNAKHFDY